VAVATLLRRLAAHLHAWPGSVPDSVLSALPETVREHFGL
jgi:hypothetical protein